MTHPTSWANDVPWYGEKTVLDMVSMLVQKL